MGLGIYSPDSIDLVTRNVRMDTWAVVLTETSQWDGSEDQLDRLERKLERYRRFVVDGEMRRLYPESRSNPPARRTATLGGDCAAVIMLTMLG